ncbi:ATP-dependent RNA helicase [Erysipelotrichaceae bacterium]|nr:ATP-dependent RNA helicase [Erysipelotrichaceae bacterium]
MLFNELKLNENILKAVAELGYTTPTKIQEEAIPYILDNRDLIGLAQTGTGKTAAFVLPILNNIQANKKPQALIVTPTRELALQIQANIEGYSKYTKHRGVCLYGGVKQTTQVRQLQQGCEIIVATPGRLLDLINQRFVKLNDITHLVLDEADNMLDMGFIHDIKKIINYLPKKRVNLLFSATMPKEIKSLAGAILVDPVEVSVAVVSSAASTVTQYLYNVDQNNKNKLLLELMADKKYQATLIFTKTKHGANNLAKVLKEAKFKVAAIHGNKSQAFRSRALQEFKEGKINTLVATDVAARGIDISDLAYVYNFDVPNVPETYVHRIGRTGRAGQEGIAISFANYEEQAFIRDVQKLIKKDLILVDDHDYPLINKVIPPKKQQQRGRSNNGGSGGNGFDRSQSAGGAKGRGRMNAGKQFNKTQHK